MTYKDVIAINGMPGLFTTLSSKSNGIVVKSLVDGKSTFVSVRTHGITPLEQISVYLQGDETIALSEVFNSMIEKQNENAVPDGAANDQALATYFKIIVPNYDEKKVHSNAMKKIVKWCDILKKNNLIPVAAEENSVESKSE